MYHLKCPFGNCFSFNKKCKEIKVAAIEVGDTCFLPILANKAVNLGVIFIIIGMYAYFYIQKKMIKKNYFF